MKSLEEIVSLASSISSTRSNSGSRIPEDCCDLADFILEHEEDFKKGKFYPRHLDDQGKCFECAGWGAPTGCNNCGLISMGR